MSDEAFYTMALTRLTGFNYQAALLLYQQLGSARAVYDHRHDIGVALDDGAQQSAAAVGELLRVVELVVMVVFGQYDGGGIDAARQTAAAGLIASGLYLSCIIMTG